MSEELDLKRLVRPNIYKLKPYSCARDEFKGNASTWIDANESAYNEPLNRYPDPLNNALKQQIANTFGYNEIAPENIFLGVGSDECIDILYRTFCRPGIDNVVAISPSYGMYGVCADINDVEYRDVQLDADTFALNAEAIAKACDGNTKLVWICSPNNPTGNSFSFEDIKQVYDSTTGLVIVDEAYIHFSSRQSLATKVVSMPRLVVMQTMSKAWGCAAIRLGIAYANNEIISIFNKVKYPYNINRLTSQYAATRLLDKEIIESEIKTVLALREKLGAELEQLPIVEKVYPSDANFLLVKVADANATYNHLCNCGVVVRNRTNVTLCNNCIRITVGTESDLNSLISALKKL